MSVFSKVAPLGGASAENRDNLAKYRNDQQHDLVVCPHLATPCFFSHRHLSSAPAFQSPGSMSRPLTPASPASATKLSPHQFCHQE